MNFYKPSISQQLIWLDQTISKEVVKYNIGGYALLEGRLSYALFDQALKATLASQEVYSSVFFERAGMVSVGLRAAAHEYRIGHLDLSSAPDPEAAAREWMERDFAAALPLQDHHLFHFRLLKLSEEKHYWYAKIHHLIGDGWSFMLLLNQTAAFYTELSRGGLCGTETFRYSDYTEDDAAYYSSAAMEADRAFWLEQFTDIPVAPFAATTRASERLAGSETLSIDRDFRLQLQQAAERQKVSLFQFIIGALAVYFSRTSQQEQLVIATPVLNRTKKYFRNTAGVFMNLLAIPFRVNDDDLFDTVVQQVKQKLSAALRHQRYQYGNLMKDLGAGARQLYGLRVSYESFDFTSDFGGLKTAAVALSNPAETDPLAIYIREYNNDGFDIRLVYNTAYFDAERMQSISRGIRSVLSHIVSQTDTPVYRIPLTDERERAALLACAQGPVRNNLYSLFIDIWRTSVASHAAFTAVSTADEHFTYEAIHASATQLAHRLLHHDIKGPVALFLSRSPSFIIAALGCMMAGRPYVPLDTDYPETRIRFILEDAACGLMITAKELEANARSYGIECLFPEEGPYIRKVPAMPAVNPSDTCYIIYTSGSTGYPKGVAISHASLADYVLTFGAYFQVGPSDCVLQQSSFSFDTSVEEIFPVLANGGRLHIARNNKDLVEIRDALFADQVTLLSTGPWTIRFLNESGVPPCLRVLINGGDVLRGEHVVRLIGEGVRVYNTYGPTESTVCASYYPVRADDTEIPIGSPIANREIYILDNHMQLQPFDTEGEICIAGAGLAQRYLNRAELTREKFVPHPFKDGAWIYRSGDRGLMRRDGLLLFKGRKDQQLNFRGYRIEAREVESALERIGIDSVVDVRHVDREPVLTAHVVVRPGESRSVADWKVALKKELPPYMIPSAWIRMDAFPLLPSGKIDRKALPDAAMSEASEKTAPSTETEQLLCRLWKEVLPLADPGIDDVFFELGGHSLNIVQLIGAVEEQFSVRLSLHQLYEQDTIRKQAVLIEASSPAWAPAAAPVVAATCFPLTDAQYRIWILSQLEAASRAYHITGALQLKGNVVPGNIKAIVEQLLTRHESLRTVFFEDASGQALQNIGPAADFMEESRSPFGFYQVAADDIDAQVQRVAAQPFDLGHGPLWRVALIGSGAGDHVLVYVLHHLIADGWSVEILVREFMFLYRNFGRQPASTLPPLATQFRNQVLRSGARDKASEEGRLYWTDRLSGRLPVIDMPTQLARPALKTYSGREVRTAISTAHLRQLHELCREEGVTLFVCLLATLNAFIYRYTGMSDTLVGAPLADRTDPGAAGQVGLFLEILPIRTSFDHRSSFRELLHLQKKEVSEAFKFSGYPLNELLASLKYRNDPSRSPLFDLFLVLHNQSITDPLADSESSGLLLEEYPVARQTSQFDMSFAFYYRKESLELRLEYNDQLFEEWFARQVAEDFVRLSMSLCLEGSVVGSASYLAPAELDLLAGRAFVPGAGLPHLLPRLNAVAETHKDVCAVTCAGRRLSYAQLMQQAARTASYLRQVAGVQPHDRVALLADPSEWLPVLICGIWMAGGIYVPLHPGNPPLRQQLILEDAGCKTVITEQTIIDIAAHPHDNADTGDCPTAYILYTSGTTGRPKGVAVSHRALATKLEAELEYMPARLVLRSPALTNYGFDVSFLELFLPLLTGGTVVVPERHLLFEQDSLGALLVQEGVNVVHGTPTYIDSLFRQQTEAMQAQLAEAVRLICMGGESLYAGVVDMLREKLPGCRLNNHYGPTEAVIHALVKEDVRSFDKNIIGSAMPGVRCYVLDKNLQLIPKGVIGDLYIGGPDAIAEGYVNRPEENAARFIDNPFVSGEMIYHTGDEVCWTRDGEVEFLGRKDDQIKIRGLRVELGEIQRLLELHEHVVQAVVCPCNVLEHKMLIAFLVYRDQPAEASVKAYLQLHLPDYMIPAQFIAVPHIPMNENGKVDRELLLSESDPNAARSAFLAPRTPAEKELAALWERVLERSPIGIRDNFFELGGNSMLLIRLRTHLKQTMGVRLEVHELLRLQTIEELAEALESLQWIQQLPEDAQKAEEFYI